MDAAKISTKSGLARYRRQDIVRDLETYITGNNLPEGIKLPSGPELALKYRVSLKTAERAMEVLVGKGLIGRRRGSGSYVKSNRTLRQLYRVGLFLWRRFSNGNCSELDHAAYGHYIQNLTGRLAEQGFACDIFQENAEDRQNLKLFSLSLCNYDAVIAAAGMLDTAAEFFKQCQIPVILVQDDVMHPGPWHQVVFDYQPGFSAALKFFLQQNKQRFFVICNTESGSDTPQHRVEAILAAAERLQIPPANLIVYAGKNALINSPVLCGRDCAEYYCRNQLLSYPVISTSDYITYGFLSYMNEQKLQAGVDFKLISYDNLEKEIKDPSMRLGISGITHPMDAAVEAVIDLLDILIIRKGVQKAFYRCCFVPARELVLRRSSGIRRDD